MTQRKLRFGILGVAHINQRLLPGFRNCRLAEVTAIASRDTEKAKAAAARDGIPRVFGSYDQLLADPDIDAVYIPLPNTLHDLWTRRAADAGKHILCEKPLCPTAAIARELVQYCHAKRVVLMDGFMWPHHPRTKKIRERIDAGAIGRVQRVTGAFTFPLQLDPANIRLSSELAGGSLLDVGCYPVFGIRWAFGEEPKSVFACGRYDYNVDLEMSGILHFEDGRVGTFDCGFTLPLRQWLEIVGDEGVISVEKMWLPDADASFTLTRKGEEPQTWKMPGFDQIACMIDDFSEAILTGTQAQPNPEEAVKTLAVLDALAMSAAEDREIDV
jgi:predicted dehydrogenase